MDFLRSFRAPDPKLLIGSFKSIFAPHYIVNVFLACSFYVLKTVPPICEYMFEDCSIELVSWHWSISFFLSLYTARPRALTRILKTGVPEPYLPKSGSPTIQKNIASFKKLESQHQKMGVQNCKLSVSESSADPLSSIIGRCTLYTPGCRNEGYIDFFPFFT